MVHEALVQMNLASAFLCAEVDCRTVSNNSVQCQRCNSQVLNLAQVLDGDKKKEADDAKAGESSEAGQGRHAA